MQPLCRFNSVTLHHPVGTASLGTVVDTQLRVKGVQNLRVMDCSVEPVLVVTNTQASALMIGEKGADMVLKYWRQIEEQEKLKHSKYGAPNHKPAPPLSKVPSYSQYGAPSPTKYGAPSSNQVSQYGAPAPQPLKMHYSTNTSPVTYGPPTTAVTESTSQITYGPPVTPPQPPSQGQQYGAPGAESSAASSNYPAEPVRFELPPQALTYSGPSWVKKRSSADPFIFENIRNTSTFMHTPYVF